MPNSINLDKWNDRAQYIGLMHGLVLSLHYRIGYNPVLPDGSGCSCAIRVQESRHRRYSGRRHRPLDRRNNNHRALIGRVMWGVERRRHQQRQQLTAIIIFYFIN